VSRDDLHVVPEGLPVPEDDGACDHLVGLELPSLVLDSSLGQVDVRGFDVLYCYPRTGRPDHPMLSGWNEIPGARGCTPQSSAFRDAHGELQALGVRVAGLSAQPLEDQLEFAERNRMPFPVISDPDLRLSDALRLPTFETHGLRLYKRVTLVSRDGVIEKVFYPVFPPDANAGEVIAWISQHSKRR
jgi:peroxiredoxin